MSSFSKSFSYIFSILGLSLAVFIASLDGAITNTALPQISQALNTDFTDAIWVVNSYQLVLVALILPLAAWADQVGYKKIFLSGLLIFILASWCCSLANSLNQLIFARALQGMGAAAILGTNIALVRLIYPSQKLGLGLGINAFIIAIGLAGGPVIAAIVLSKLSWQWLFLMNIPLGIMAFVTAFFLPASNNKIYTRFNFVSAFFIILMFASVIYALGEFAVSGSMLFPTLCIGIGMIAGVILYLREKQHVQPIFPFDLFQNTIFSLSILTAFAAFVTQGLVLVALPYVFFQSGYVESEIGFLIAPWPVMGAITAPIAGILSNRISSAFLGAIGLCLLACSLAVLAYFSVSQTYILIVLCMACCGIGFGLFLTPNQRMLMLSSPTQQSGVAGGMLNVARTAGQAVGAVLVALCIHFSQDSTAMMLWLGCVVALFAALVSFCRKAK